MNNPVPPPMPSAAPAVPPPMPPAAAFPPPLPPAAAFPPPMPPAAAKLPNKFRLLVIAGCAALALLVVVVIAFFALSRSPAEQCVDTANDARSAILEGRAGDLYDLMPSSWQKDLDGQLRLLATRIDEDTFEQTTKLAGELADLLDDKEDVMIERMKNEESKFIGLFADKEGLRILSGALRAISRWQYDDLREGRFNRLFDDRRVAPLLERVIRASMDKNETSASEFTLVDPDQTETVTLHIFLTERRYDGWDNDTYQPRYKKVTSEKELDWVRFDGGWVPIDLLRPKHRSDGWHGWMSDLREGIENISDRDLRTFRERVMKLRTVLPLIRNCKTGSEMQRVFREMR